MKILKASNYLGLPNISNVVVFIIAYLAVMVLTYVLPYYGSNSYAVGFLSSFMLKGWGLMPQTWMHIWALSILILIAYVRGIAIGKIYLVAFPIIATAFDLLPGMNSIPLVPTVMHLLTLVLGAMGGAKKSSEESGGVPAAMNSASHAAAIGCLLITLLALAGSAIYWTTFAYRKSQIIEQRSQKTTPHTEPAKPTTPASPAVSPAIPPAPPPVPAPVAPAPSPAPTQTPKPVVVPTPSASVATPNASPMPPANPANKNTIVAQELLNDADLCFAKKKYECAINEGNAVLKIDPGNIRAKTLVQKAHAEQKKALESISIQ